MFYDNINRPVIITGVHWRDVSAKYLLISYRHHGVQCVLDSNLGHDDCLSIVWQNLGCQRSISVYERPKYFHSLVSVRLNCQCGLREVIRHFGRGRSSLSPDFKYLAIAMQAGIDIYELESKTPRVHLQTNGVPSTPVIFIHGGEAVFAGCGIGQVRLWGRALGKRLQTLSHDGTHAFKLTFHTTLSHDSNQ